MEEDGLCKFWLPKKNRFCANAPLVDSPFCGNHKPRSDGQWLPCPVDPSHSVLKENLEGHVKRCPLMKQTQSLSQQPFYEKGINAGEGGDDECDVVSSEMKRSVIYSMNVAEFCNLIKKIEAVHALLCGDIRGSYLMPEACNVWIKGEVDRKLPFQEKHVLQQASILGNLEKFGVVRSSVEGGRCDGEGLTRGNSDCAPAVVEFGAGRGYLTQMLADCYGIEKVFLVERKSYKLKADRSLRQIENLSLERLRIDIEDLNLNAVESLSGVSYLGIGKHLCGPATDLTLRCCVSQQYTQVTRKGNVNLQGLAIATCCHHICQWKQYINKEFFSNLGMTKKEFNAITWFTSWAVDADHGSDLPNSTDLKSQLQPIEEISHGGDVEGVDEFVRKMKAVERAVLGFKCKQIIDIGRKIWAKERGLDTHLGKYVPLNVSPENLLIAKHP